MVKYSEISVAEATQIIDKDKPILIDVRDQLSYKEGHIEGAMLSHEGLIEQLYKQRQFERPVVVYCYHGNSSKEIAEFLGGIGFKHVYSMKGGYLEWRKLTVQ